MKKKSEEFSLSDFFRIFLPKLWLIVLVAVLCGALIGSYSSYMQEDTYTSRSMIMVTKTTGGSLSSTDRYLAADIIELCENVIKTDNFLSGVVEEIKIYCNDPSKISFTEQKMAYTKNYVKTSLTTASLKSMIDISQRGDTELFDLSVTTKDPVMSYVFATVLQTEIVNSLFSGNSFSTEQLPFTDLHTRVMEDAAYSEVANSKNVLRNTLVGVLAGAALTMVIIFALAMLDVVIHDRKKLDDSFDVPVLGVIPRFEVGEEEGK